MCVCVCLCVCVCVRVLVCPPPGCGRGGPRELTRGWLGIRPRPTLGAGAPCQPVAGYGARRQGPAAVRAGGWTGYPLSGRCALGRGLGFPPALSPGGGGGFRARFLGWLWVVSGFGLFGPAFCGPGGAAGLFPAGWLCRLGGGVSGRFPVLTPVGCLVGRGVVGGPSCFCGNGPPQPRAARGPPASALGLRRSGGSATRPEQTRATPRWLRPVSGSARAAAGRFSCLVRARVPSAPVIRDGARWSFVVFAQVGGRQRRPPSAAQRGAAFLRGAASLRPSGRPALPAGLRMVALVVYRVFTLRNGTLPRPGEGYALPRTGLL